MLNLWQRYDDEEMEDTKFCLRLNVTLDIKIQMILESNADLKISNELGNLKQCNIEENRPCYVTQLSLTNYDNCKYSEMKGKI